MDDTAQILAALQDGHRANVVMAPEGAADEHGHTRLNIASASLDGREISAAAVRDLVWEQKAARLKSRDGAFWVEAAQ